MKSIGHEHDDDPSFRHRAAKSKLEDLLSDPGSLNWDDVDGLIHQLSPSTPYSRFSAEADPMGRLFLGKLLSKNPPASSVEAALRVFPESLSHNPAAFFMACRDASPEVIAQMMRQSLGVDACNDECPYPWIFSGHVSVDGAKAILEVYPQGVLQKSAQLSSLSPLDYFLMAEDMIEQREFDLNLWNKFKLMLIAAECCEGGGRSDHGFSPVHTMLKRILSRPGMYSLD